MTPAFQPNNFNLVHELKNNLVHELKNRIRILVPILEKDPERTYIFEIILKKRPEIKTIKSIPEIGSVTLYFDHNSLPKENLLTILDMVLGNIGKKKISLPPSNIIEDTSVPIQDMSLAIEGMTCASCALLLEMSLKKDPRVHNATVNFASAIASTNGRLSRQDMAEIISKVGYKANLMDTLSQRQELIRKEHQRLASAKKRFIWASVLSAPVVAIGMAMPAGRIFHWIQFALTTPVVFAAGGSFFSKA
jgi:Cu+-exporting ATPase